MDWNIISIGISFAAIVFAVRWRNTDPKAGFGIAVAGVVLMFIYVIFTPAIR